MSVSPKSDSLKSEKLIDSVDATNRSEPVRSKTSKYVMTCGTPSPPKSPEISTKNAQNSYTSFSISSILNRHDSSEKNVTECKSSSTESNSTSSSSGGPYPVPPSTGFMPHIGNAVAAAAALHPCSSDSLMLSRWVEKEIKLNLIRTFNYTISRRRYGGYN